MLRLAKYLKDRENVDSIITDHGFASYSICGLETYIKDIWVDQDYRNNHGAAQMADMIALIAKDAGCKYLTGSVCVNANKADDSIKVLLAYGMSVFKAENNMIYFKKEL